MKHCRLPIFLAFLALCGSALAQAPRQELNLAGDWEYVRVPDLATGPPAEGWQPMKIPGLLNGYDYERAWFRRQFTVPATMQGRLVLHFGGVKWNSLVRINGREVGRHFGGYEPFEVDITAAVKADGPQLLELGCHDWTGVFSDRETDFSVMRERPTDLREVPRDKILAPIGGLVNSYGPWDEISLRCHPAVYVKEVFIKPSVTQHLLRAEYTLANLSAQPAEVSLAATAEAEGKAALELPARTATVPANGETQVVLQQPWPQPHLWSPQDPYLYYLLASLKQGDRTLDVQRERFGFREFTTKGSRFYLNGVPVTLLATSWWPELFKDKEYIAGRLRAIKQANCVAFRTHTQPWPELWYETADEIGVMMIPEGAVWNDDTAYRINDPRFWDNYAAHLQAMVLRDRNKPSVVMYSLENEFYGSALNNDSPARKDLARMGQLVKQWDPTRPIMYESDGDPEGVADVIGIHYPHEYPDFTEWPNTADWLGTPMPAAYWFVKDPAQRKSWRWDRSKPLYIGEFLWVPSSDPSWHTVFYGDDAYLDYELYRVKAKGDSWRAAIAAYRRGGVGGISPWTMVEGGPLDAEHNPMYAAQQYAMQPQAAYLREYDHCFYGGATVRRTADIYNDTLTDADLTLRWGLIGNGQTLQQGEKALAVPAGERRETAFELALPGVTGRQEAELRLQLDCGGKTVFNDTRRWSVFPPLSLREAPAVGVYDPSGETVRKLAAAGLRTVPVDSLSAAPPPGVQVLIVGARTLQAGEQGPPVIGAGNTSEALLRFVRGGGRVLVLEQEQYPLGMLPVSPSAHRSTMTFPLMPQHPVLAGVQPEDLKWWAPDNVVTQAEPPRPTSGGARALVVSGSRDGLAFAPLLEYPLGQGTLLLCQLRVGERLGVEPTAGLLLGNALAYLQAFRPSPARTGVLAAAPETVETLTDVGLQFTNLASAPEAAWSALDLLIICGAPASLGAHLPQLEAVLQRGGTVLLHGLPPADYEPLRAALGLEFRITPYRGAVSKVADNTGLAGFFANEDLYWLGKQQSAISWATLPRADEAASAVISRTFDSRAATEYTHEKMAVAGAHTSLDARAAHLPSGGSTATLEIAVPREGTYILGVVAGGSAAQGTWPAGTVAVDGKAFGSFACQRGDFDTYSVEGRLRPGKHEVTIRFANDFYDEANKQDRNLDVKALLVAEAPPQEGVQLLTSPAAAAVVRCRGGRVVLDNINWDTTRTNTDKARRYICGLLSGLNAPFAAGGTGTVIDMSRFEPDPQMPWFRREGTSALLAASGYMSAKVEVAKAGQYAVRITAKGTPLQEVYPLVRVEWDGSVIGQVQVNSPEWRRYPLQLTLPQGTHELKLVFANDANEGGEDRNLWLGSVEVEAEP